MPITSTSAEGQSVGSVLRLLWSDPRTRLVARWNWKTGLLSGLVRTGVLAAVVLPGGGSALALACVELLLRVAFGGFYGTLAEALRTARPVWLAGVWLGVLLPGAVHVVEYAAFSLVPGAPVRSGLAASVSFSAVSLLFTWHAMRQGALLTGSGAPSLAVDLGRLPAIVGALLWAAPRCVGALLRRGSSCR